MRSKPSPWGAFMINKYSKKYHLVIAHSRGASPVWKKLVTVRELIEHQILWQIRMGAASFCLTTGLLWVFYIILYQKQRKRRLKLIILQIMRDGYKD